MSHRPAPEIIWNDVNFFESFYRTNIYDEELHRSIDSNDPKENTDFLFDPMWMDVYENDPDCDKLPLEDLLSNTGSEMSPAGSDSFSPPPICNVYLPHVPSIIEFDKEHSYDDNYQLRFTNPPESRYHVRYQSEITNYPVNGNIVNTKKKTKKNISGRYLKGSKDRYVTIALPHLNMPYSNLYIRVTRLTVPFHGISFIHPYPLLYSPPKKKSQTEVITKDVSIYYKLTQEDIKHRVKKFPNMILTRLKQCQLKQIHSLQSFNNPGAMYPFLGDNAKSKIAQYQLKQSELDFRLVEFCPAMNDFIDKGLFCRTSPLVEEEGTECRKMSSTSVSMRF